MCTFPGADNDSENEEEQVSRSSKKRVRFEAVRESGDALEDNCAVKPARAKRGKLLVEDDQSGDEEVLACAAMRFRIAGVRGLGALAPCVSTCLTCVIPRPRLTHSSSPA